MKPIHWIVIAIAVLAVVAYFVIPKKAIKANQEAEIKKAIAEAQEAKDMATLIKIGTAYLDNPYYSQLETALHEQIAKIPTSISGANPHPMALAGENKFRHLQISQIANPNAQS